METLTKEPTTQELFAQLFDFCLEQEAKGNHINLRYSGSVKLVNLYGMKGKFTNQDKYLFDFNAYLDSDHAPFTKETVNNWILQANAALR